MAKKTIKIVKKVEERQLDKEKKQCKNVEEKENMLEKIFLDPVVGNRKKIKKQIWLLF